MDSAPSTSSLPARSAGAWKHDLGVTVRRLREARALTRGGLAERSGLSLRFLADVEGGKANPSLGSLHDLARALQVGVVTLVDSATDSVVSGDMPSPVIALLGLRGAGKSTIGKRAAKALGWTFVELDAEVERDAGMSLAELFPLYGEDHYRALEAKDLRRKSGTMPKSWIMPSPRPLFNS